MVFYMFFKLYKWYQIAKWITKNCDVMKLLSYSFLFLAFKKEVMRTKVYISCLAFSHSNAKYDTKVCIWSTLILSNFSNFTNHNSFVVHVAFKKYMMLLPGSLEVIIQLTFTCPKSAKEIVEKDVKYLQS